MFNDRQRDDLLEMFVKAYRDKELARRTVDLVEFMWLQQHKGDWMAVALAFSKAGFAASDLLRMEAIAKDLWTFQIDGRTSVETFKSFAEAADACDKACQESSKTYLKCRIVRPSGI